MQNYAIANNLTPFISMQNHYSVLYREEEREMMPTLKVQCRSSTFLGSVTHINFLIRCLALARFRGRLLHEGFLRVL